MISGSRPVRVVVCESNPMASQLLAEALSKEPEYGIVASVVERSLLYQTVLRLKPDVVLLSAPGGEARWEGHGGHGPMLDRMLPCPWILLFDRTEAQLVVAAFRAGAKGVFCRTQCDIKLLAKCVRKVAEGQIWADNKQILFLVGALTGGDGRRQPSAARLTARELSVICRVVQGLSNREIAEQLRLSEHTIKNYLFQIFDKLGVSNRVELALYAVAKLDLSDSFDHDEEPAEQECGPPQAESAPEQLLKQ